MPGLSQATARGLLDLVLRGTAFAASTLPIKTVLLSATATNTTDGTEITGGSYPAGGINSTFGAADTAQTSANDAAVTQTNMPAVTVTGVQLRDSAGTPRRIAYGPLSASKTTNLGDTLSFSTAALTVAIQSTNP